MTILVCKNVTVIIIVFLSFKDKASAHSNRSMSKQRHDHTFEERLVRTLLRPYERSMRPVFEYNQTVLIRMSATLSQIIDVNLRQQKIVTSIWLDHEWTDQRLRWDPERFSGVQVVRLPHTMVWLPDIVLYNSADDQSDYQDSLVIVGNDGSVFWPPIVHLHSYCRMDVTHFPYDDQFFYLKFGSWSHTGDLVDVEIRNDGVDLSNYIPNGEWDMIEVKAVRSVIYYPCCPEPFPDVTFYFHIRRRILYYILNIILPTTILSALALLSFCLPTHCSEKVTLSLTVLLAYTVFLMTVSESLPRTSEFLPIFSVFITLVMTITAASTICSIFVIQVRFRGRAGKEPPTWLLMLARRGIFGSLLHVIKRAGWCIISCALCSVYPNDGNMSDVSGNYVASTRQTSPVTKHRPGLVDQNRPLSIRQPKGLGAGRDEQEYLFTVVDEWNECNTSTWPISQRPTAPLTPCAECKHGRHSEIYSKKNRAKVSIGKRFAKYADAGNDHSEQMGGFVSSLDSAEDSDSVDDDDDDGGSSDDFDESTGHIYESVAKPIHKTVNRSWSADCGFRTSGNVEANQAMNASSRLFADQTNNSVHPVKQGNRKRIVAYKRSPIMDRISCRNDASRYDRNITAMLRNLAKQNRLKVRDHSIEKLWSESLLTKFNQI